MTQTVEISSSAGRAGESRIIWVVSAAHFLSHYYMLLLPPLFPFVRAEYGVSYTELGLAIAAFNVVTAALQTPAGFATDRFGALPILIIGLVLGGTAFALIALVPSYWFLVAMFAVAGLGNTSYHPADYSILSHKISPKRIGHAFSIHTFAGMMGFAVAPASSLLLEAAVGWRGAFMAAGLVGLAIAAILALYRDSLLSNSAQPVKHAGDDALTAPVGWRLLLSLPIMRNLALFTTLGLTNAGLQAYSVVALISLHGTPLPTANMALTGLLLMTAIGVLVGGLVATRTSRHDLVAAAALVMAALGVTPLALFDLGPVALVLAMSISGLFSGLLMPSRDMIVRQITPPGSFGKVFGFVSTGFSIGGIIAPPLFGWLMDRGQPASVFLLCAAFSLISILGVVGGHNRASPRAVRQ